MNDIEWEDFLKFLNEVEKGNGPEPFAPFERNTNPRTWEELIARIENLPGDDPITWLPLSEKL